MLGGRKPACGCIAIVDLVSFLSEIRAGPMRTPTITLTLTLTLTIGYNPMVEELLS